MSLEIPYHEQEPPVDAIKAALVSLKTNLWAIKNAPNGPYKQAIIDHAERARAEIEAWLAEVT